MNHRIRQNLTGVFAWLLPWLAWAATAPPPPAMSEIEQMLQQAGAQRPSSDSLRALKVVLLADVKDHGPGAHDYPCWQSRWALLFGGAAASRESAANLDGEGIPHPETASGAARVQVVNAEKWPDDTTWQTADLVAAFCYLAWNTQRIQQVEAYLKRGGGLVLIHSATWTKPKPSPEVASVAGVGGFQKWRHGSLTLEVLQAGHPIFKGLPAIINLEDESYWPPTPPLAEGKIKVLAGSRELANPGDAAPSLQPMFWTYELGQGRVFGCVPGHFSWTFDNPYFRTILLRGMAWAARENPYRFDPLVLRGARVK